MSFLFDTDILIDISRGQTVAKQAALFASAAGIAISGMNYGELWRGTYNKPDQMVAAADLEALLAPFTILWSDIETMRIFGRVAHFLDKRGLPIDAPDIIIAATVLRHDLILVSRNLRHFQRIPDLQILTPTEIVIRSQGTRH